LWLYGAVGALALAALACEFLLPPLVAGASEAPLNSAIADLIYPLGDVLLMCFGLGVLAVTGWRPGRVLGTVVAGLALGGLADACSLYWSATGHAGARVLDSLWAAPAGGLGG